MTTYRKAWIEYKKSKDYKWSSDAMKTKGIKQPYRDNILQSAFAIGWSSGSDQYYKQKKS